MAGEKKLAVNVHAQKDGEIKYFEAGSTPPAEWAKVITNPKAWGGKAPTTDASDDDKSKQGPVEPPRSGAGSGDKAWVEYGTAVGLDVSTGKKADIIAALDARSAAEKASQAGSSDDNQGSSDDDAQGAE